MWIIFVFLKKVIFYYQSNSPGKMPALLNDQKKDFFTRQTKKQENWKLDTKIFFLNLIIKMMFDSTVVRLTPLSVPGWRRQASSPWGWLAAGHDWLEGCHRLATVGSGFWAGVTTWADRVKREESCLYWEGQTKNKATEFPNMLFIGLEVNNLELEALETKTYMDWRLFLTPQS